MTCAAAVVSSQLGGLAPERSPATLYRRRGAGKSRIEQVLVGGDGEAVALFVFGVAGVAVDVLGVDFVLGEEVVDFLPEVAVFGRFVLGGGAAPAAGLPLGEPVVDALGDVLAVGDEFDTAAALEGFEAVDDGLELHAVVGGGGF